MSSMLLIGQARQTVLAGIARLAGLYRDDRTQAPGHWQRGWLPLEARRRTVKRPAQAAGIPGGTTTREGHSAVKWLAHSVCRTRHDHTQGFVCGQTRAHLIRSGER
jgi:hypothetical protein